MFWFVSQIKVYIILVLPSKQRQLACNVNHNKKDYIFMWLCHTQNYMVDVHWFPGFYKTFAIMHKKRCQCKLTDIFGITAGLKLHITWFNWSFHILGFIWVVSHMGRYSIMGVTVNFLFDLWMHIRLNFLLVNIVVFTKK